MKKIYFAAPLFNEMELKRNKEITKKYRNMNCKIKEKACIGQLNYSIILISANNM